jgi:hypothetical protein
LCEPAADNAHRSRIVRRADLCRANTAVVRQRSQDWLDNFNTLDTNWFNTLNANWQADDRRRLLAVARDLLHLDYAGHRTILFGLHRRRISTT